jgi:hypothetical protein
MRPIKLSRNCSETTKPQLVPCGMKTAGKNYYYILCLNNFTPPLYGYLATLCLYQTTYKYSLYPHLLLPFLFRSQCKNFPGQTFFAQRPKSSSPTTALFSSQRLHSFFLDEKPKQNAAPVPRSCHLRWLCCRSSDSGFQLSGCQ